MRLWSFQHKDALEDISSSGVYRANPKESEFLYPNGAGNPPCELFYPAYNWMSTQMKQKLPHCEGAQTPIWCWVDTESVLEEKSLLLDDKGLILLHLGVDDSRILVSDYLAWDRVLNNSPYITESLLDGLPDEHFEEVIYDYSRWCPGMKELSWQGIFTITGGKQFLQATIWEIREEDILDLEFL